MTGGDKIFNEIAGMNMILGLKPKFAWRHLNYIESLKYYIDFNDTFDEVSFLEIGFLMREIDNQKSNRILIKFNEVNSFEIKDLGGNYNQIMGFEVIDQKGSGLEPHMRYLIRDYEDSRIKFSCRSIIVVSVA